MYKKFLYVHDFTLAIGSAHSRIIGDGFLIRPILCCVPLHCFLKVSMVFLSFAFEFIFFSIT